MRETRTYGSVRGASSNGRPYRDPPESPEWKKGLCSIYNFTHVSHLRYCRSDTDLLATLSLDPTLHYTLHVYRRDEECEGRKENEHPNVHFVCTHYVIWRASNNAHLRQTLTTLTAWLARLWFSSS